MKLDFHSDRIWQIFKKQDFMQQEKAFSYIKIS